MKYGGPFKKTKIDKVPQAQIDDMKTFKGAKFIATAFTKADKIRKVNETHDGPWGRFEGGEEK